VRFIGVLLVLLGGSLIWFLGVRGLTLQQMRDQLLRIFQLPAWTPWAATTSGNGAALGAGAAGAAQAALAGSATRGGGSGSFTP